MEELSISLNNLQINKEIKYIDLFCGLGAFHTAFNRMSRIKYKCVFSCDIDNSIRDIYELNYNISPAGDINNIDINEIPDFDILCGGFPCQPFSIAGNKKGLEDNRGNLFFSILKIIDIKKPTIIILENVKNLLTINNGFIFNKIKNELENRKYFVSYKVINSADYGSPQSKTKIIYNMFGQKRIYIYGQHGK